MVRVFACVIALFASTSVLAADNGLYFGAALSQSKIDVDLDAGASNFHFDGNDTKYKAILGFRPFDWLAAEVNYIDFGSIDVPRTTVTPAGEYSLKGIDAFVLGIWEIGLVDIFAKAGGVQFDREVEGIPNFQLEEDSGFEVALGAGLGVHFGSLGARIEYEKFDIADDTTIDVISLGVTWTLF